MAGTTASGKSHLALEIAERTGGHIVNADSVQLYRDLPVLTASPDASEKARAPHHLYNFLDAREPATAAAWLGWLKPVLEQAQSPLILVGGTGLYIKAMIRGLPAMPDIVAAIRDEVRSMTGSACRAALEHEDPSMAQRLEPGDTQRNMRALEVIRSTGRSLASWQDDPVQRHLPAIDVRGLCLLPDRAMLRERIHRRMATMLNAGAIEEVEALRAHTGDPMALPIAKTHGLIEVIQLIDGEIDRETAVTRTAIKVRQYAKRQATWFRHQLPELSIVEHFGEEALTLDAALTLFRDKG